MLTPICHTVRLKAKASHPGRFSLHFFALGVWFFSALILLTAFSLPAQAQNLDYPYTQTEVDKINNRIIFFAHQSVGRNITGEYFGSASTAGLLGTGVNTTFITGSQRPGNTKGFTSYQPLGGSNANGFPLSKIAAFEDLMNNTPNFNPDIAFFKFCYDDRRWSTTDVNALWEAYRDAFTRLEAAHPSVRFVHVTMPLLTASGGNNSQYNHEFNQLLRNHSPYSGFVFDLAALEAVDPNGNAVLHNGYPALAPGWASDQWGHLSQAGGTHVAAALIGFLANVPLINDPAQSAGAFTITGGTQGTSWNYAANTLTVRQSGTYTITMTTSGATTTTDRIVVASGVTANITLNGVGINLSTRTGDSDDNAAFLMESRATVNLTLTGVNLLASGENRAGLQVPSDGARLTIGGAGTLTATSRGGAGIGGSSSDTGGIITINSGNVNATGGGRGAGIGDGGGIGSLSLAAANKRRLMNYLRDNYGTNIIAGQMDADWSWGGAVDMVDRVYRDTRRYPALKGFDFMQLPLGGPTYSYYNYAQQQIDEAIHWWNGRGENGAPLTNQPQNIHGIVSFMWHWRAGPNKADGSIATFYQQNTTFRIPWTSAGGWNTASPAYTEMMGDLDRVAALLKQLQERGIPVLWRPLHEAAGNRPTGGNAFFWWGQDGPAPYIALWEHMYNYFTVEKGLDNLIWVWTGEHSTYFPNNPATVDIASIDYYPYWHDSPTPTTAPTNSAFRTQFNRVVSWIPESERTRIMIAMTENGTMPNPQRCVEDGVAMWSWFMTWVDGNDVFWSSDQHNPQSHKEAVYLHPNVITFDKLPDLTQYRLN